MMVAFTNTIVLLNGPTRPILCNGNWALRTICNGNAKEPSAMLVGLILIGTVVGLDGMARPMEN